MNQERIRDIELRWLPPVSYFGVYVLAGDWHFIGHLVGFSGSKMCVLDMGNVEYLELRDHEIEDLRHQEAELRSLLSPDLQYLPDVDFALDPRELWLRTERAA